MSNKIYLFTVSRISTTVLNTFDTQISYLSLYFFTSREHVNELVKKWALFLMTYDNRVSRDLTCIITICIFFIDGCVCSLVSIILSLAVDLLAILLTFILEQTNVTDFVLISESQSVLTINPPLIKFVF